MKWITTAILAVSLAPSLVSAQGCGAWLIADFWVLAGELEVTRCTDRRVEERDEAGASPLHLAAGYGNVSAVNALVARDPDAVNRMDDRGYTPLHYAAESNANPDMISALLALGAVVDIRSEEDTSALDLAAGYARDPEILRLLLAAGANAAPEFDTVSHAPDVPIVFAARYNSNPEVLDVLLAAGATLDAADMRGYGLLHMAIQSENQPEMVAALLSKGMDVNMQQMDGYTPLAEAILSGASAEVISLLLQAGADVNRADDFGVAPLAHAVGKRVSGEIFEMLVAAGADIFAVDEYSYTAMHMAAGQRDNLDMVKRLLAHGANINDMNYERVTPLHIAAAMGSVEMINEMLARGANPAIANMDGMYAYDEFVSYTSRHSAGMEGRALLEVLKQAITPPPEAPDICGDWGKGAFWADVTLQKVEACLPFVDVYAPTDNSETPLMRALRSGVDIAIIRALLSVGPEVGAQDIAGSTALHHAVSVGRADLVTLLLAREANPNAVDKAGQTPLHRASQLDADAPIAQLLREKGADPAILDHEGRAAGDIQVELQPYSSGN